MEEGAMGIASALIYVPDTFNSTEELIHMAHCAKKHNGMYISHMLAEGDNIFDALEEFMTITRTAQIKSEIYHLKICGSENWDKYDRVIATIEAAQKSGLDVTADMYPYTAGFTALSASIPSWGLEGGKQKAYERMRDPETKEKLAQAMRTKVTSGENIYYMTGPEKIRLLCFKNPELQKFTGMSLADIHTQRKGTSPEFTLMELLLEDDSDIYSAYFFTQEENMKKQILLPWVSVCSDSDSICPEGVFLKSFVHPRTYGAFARYLGEYSIRQKIIPVQEAIRKMTSLPAKNLKIRERGILKEGFFADVVVFKEDEVKDLATYENPHQFSTGVYHVFVNGKCVLKDRVHTGVFPGRVIHGPGKK